MQIFAKENKVGAPVNSAIFSTVIVQIFLIVTYFSASTYQFFYGISASMMMIPYFLSCLFYAKTLLSKKSAGEIPKKDNSFIQRAIAIVGTIYGVWLIYSAGLSRLLMATFLLIFGVLFYVKHQKEQGKKLFVYAYDKVFVAVIVIGAIITVVLKVTGKA